MPPSGVENKRALQSVEAGEVYIVSESRILRSIPGRFTDEDGRTWNSGKDRVGERGHRSVWAAIGFELGKARISDLPQIVNWPKDGGPFITMPQVCIMRCAKSKAPVASMIRIAERISAEVRSAIGLLPIFGMIWVSIRFSMSAA